MNTDSRKHLPARRPPRFVCPDCASANPVLLRCVCGGQRLDTKKDAVKAYLGELDEDYILHAPARRASRYGIGLAVLMTVGVTLLAAGLGAPIWVALAGHALTAAPLVYYLLATALLTQRFRREPRFTQWSALPPEESALDPQAQRQRAKLRGVGKAMNRGAHYGWSGGV